MLHVCVGGRLSCVTLSGMFSAQQTQLVRFPKLCASPYVHTLHVLLRPAVPCCAALRCPVPCRDVLDIHDGKIESYVCIGFNQGAQVTCLAFHPSGKLLVRHTVGSRLFHQHSSRGASTPLLPAACMVSDLSTAMLQALLPRVDCRSCHEALHGVVS